MAVEGIERKMNAVVVVRVDRLGKDTDTDADADPSQRYFEVDVQA